MRFMVFQSHFFSQATGFSFFLIKNLTLQLMRKSTTGSAPFIVGVFFLTASSGTKPLENLAGAGSEKWSVRSRFRWGFLLGGILILPSSFLRIHLKGSISLTNQYNSTGLSDPYELQSEFHGMYPRFRSLLICPPPKNKKRKHVERILPNAVGFEFMLLIPAASCAVALG